LIIPTKFVCCRAPEAPSSFNANYLSNENQATQLAGITKKIIMAALYSMSTK